MKLPEIVGIAGTNASGKDTLGRLRESIQNAKMVSLSDILREELDRRSVAHERENLRSLSAEWRAKGGEGVLAVKSIEQYQKEKQVKGYSGLSIVSLRKAEEAEAIQNAGGVIIWIDADVEVRYQRIKERLKKENRVSDLKTFEEFVAEEEAEMSPDKNSGGLDMSAVKAIADIAIINEFSSEQDYEEYLKKEFELV